MLKFPNEDLMIIHILRCCLLLYILLYKERKTQRQKVKVKTLNYRWNDSRWYL